MNIEELKRKWGGSLPQVGDWVEQNNIYFKIGALGILSIIPISCNPVRLTPELIETLQEQNPETKELFCDALLSWEENYLLIEGRDFWGDYYEITRLEYFHQVQQLYRMLTKGKELTYTP